MYVLLYVLVPVTVCACVTVCGGCVCLCMCVLLYVLVPVTVWGLSGLSTLSSAAVTPLSGDHPHFLLVSVLWLVWTDCLV